MDDKDKAILNLIQSDFPIEERPFLTIGEELSLTEDEVIKRVAALRKKGIIRRIGGNFSPESLGFVSTLCAAKVPSEKIELFARTVNSYQGVTHNYERDNHYNIWFTFIAPNMDEIEKNLLEISEQTGIRDILNLPASHVYKIRAEFKV